MMLCEICGTECFGRACNERCAMVRPRIEAETVAKVRAMVAAKLGRLKGRGDWRDGIEHAYEDVIESLDDADWRKGDA